MKISFVAISIVALLIIQSNVHSAEIHLDDEMSHIPAKISNLYTCGHWKYDGKTGFYRIVNVDWHYGCSLLYIQWMLGYEHTGGLRTEVLHTLSIREFNADDHIEFTFDKPECLDTKDGIKLDIVANCGHTTDKHHIKIEIFSEFGKYTFKKRVEKREPLTNQSR